MSSRLVRFLPVLVLLFVALSSMMPTVSGQGGQPSTRNGEWPHYTGDVRGTRYSPLDQINASNFSKLEIAWRFKTDMFGPARQAAVRAELSEGAGRSD